MVYVPGSKAKAEFRAFTKRGGPRVLEIEQTPPALSFPVRAEPTPIERELIRRGVTASTARELVVGYPEGRITAQVEHFDWLAEKHPKKVKENPGGYLASAIREDYAPPKGFETKADREKRLDAEKIKRRRELDDARRKRAHQLREAELERRITERWDGMTPDEQATLTARAIAETDEETRRTYEETDFGPGRRLLESSIRRGFLRRTIEGEPPSH